MSVSSNILKNKDGIKRKQRIYALILYVKFAVVYTKRIKTKIKEEKIYPLIFFVFQISVEFIVYNKEMKKKSTL